MDEQRNVVGSMHFSKDDTVQCFADPSKVGVVLSLGGDSSDSSNEDEEEEEEEDEGEMHDGVARVLWNNGKEDTVELSEIRVIDRFFFNGDIVALSKDPLGQTGVVQQVEMYVDLQYPNGEIVKHVNTRKLRRFKHFMEGDYVVRDHWMGRVEDVIDNVTVMFDDGAKCKIIRADPSRLVPVASRSYAHDGHCCYYPGLRVRAVSSALYRGGKWLKGSWKPNRTEATVCRVDIASVSVNWLGIGNASDSPVPTDHQDTGELIRLPYFIHTNWRLGDHTLPPKSVHASKKLSASDGEVSVEKQPHDAAVSFASEPSSSEQPQDNTTLIWRKHRRCTLKRERRKVSKKKGQAQEAAVTITRAEHYADVVWQDGSRSSGLPTTSLITIQYLGENDFWPEQYVLERSSEVEEEDTHYRRVGIVKSVDAKERMARVKWFKRVDSPVEPREFDKEERVSVYEIMEHPEYSYILGDLVIRLTPVTMAERLNLVTESQSCSASPTQNEAENSERSAAVEEKEVLVDQKSTDLSWVGAIIGLEDGEIQVEWANGVVSKVGPQEVFVVNRDDDGESSDDEVDDSASWETVDTDEMSDLEVVRQAEEPNGRPAQGDQDTAGSSQGGPLSLVFAIMSRIVSTIFGLRAKKVAVGEPSLQNEASPDHTESRTEETEEDEVEENEKKPSSRAIEDGASNDTVSDEGSRVELSTCTRSSVTPIKHFDVVLDPSDHHFMIENIQIQRKWLKKVNQEWSILQNNLPETIYVRMYEDRMDLLRAVILGADGTPYHDGLFVFDLFLSADYPSVPPAVHYHSGGLRLNPNLYENGKVCLSLLNTWTGKGSELWNPGTSNILQVLVSIQGLVLNAKPYFNEAGYERQTGTGEGEKNSVAYNENTFLLSCKSILYLLRRPPMHLEELIRSHFRSRAFKFMSACKAYLQGVPVGSLTSEGARTAESDSQGGAEASVGFKLLLSKLVPKLAAAFVEIGATDCKEFLETP